MADILFATALDMTITGSLVIIIVLLARLLLKKAPKVISYSLWIVVLLRLLCPVQIQSPVSVLPKVTSVAENYALENADISFIQGGVAAMDSVRDLVSGNTKTHQIPVQNPATQDPVQSPVVEQTPGYISANAKDIWIWFGSYLWAAGFGIMVLYSVVSILLLKRKLREAVLQEKGIYQTDKINTPFVMGLFAPKIYLPLGLNGREKELILAHEKHHIHRLDHIWKALGFLTLSIHWFNPLVWLAFILACRDMEMSCDEAVVKKLGADIRSEYATVLLNITAGRRFVAGSPLAFGESNPKGRIRNLSRWKKPILWISIAAVALCAVLAVCLLTNPASQDFSGDGSSYFFGLFDSANEDKQKLNGNQEENVKPLYGGVTHYDNLMAVLQPGYPFILDYFEVPYQETQPTAHRQFNDVCLQEKARKYLSSTALNSDDAIVAYAWELEPVLEISGCIPKDHIPVAGSTFANDVVMIVYAPVYYIEKKELWMRFRNIVSDEPEESMPDSVHIVTGSEVYVFVSAEDGHVIYIK